MAADELRRLQLVRDPGLALVDVRGGADFAAGHIQGARNAPGGAPIQGLPRDGKIVVYCAEDPCPLTSSFANGLISDGYAGVFILGGGLPAWTAKGYPLETSGGVAATPPSNKVSAADAGSHLAAGALAVDVRPATEFAAGHLPRARNVPLETLDTALVALPKDRELVVYDRLASRSRQAVEKLEAAGLKATELSGGLAGWVKKGLPLEVK